MLCFVRSLVGRERSERSSSTFACRTLRDVEPATAVTSVRVTAGRCSAREKAISVAESKSSPPPRPKTATRRRIRSVTRRVTVSWTICVRVPCVRVSLACLRHIWRYFIQTGIISSFPSILSTTTQRYASMLIRDNALTYQY